MGGVTGNRTHPRTENAGVFGEPEEGHIPGSVVVLLALVAGLAAGCGALSHDGRGNETSKYTLQCPHNFFPTKIV